MRRFVQADTIVPEPGNPQSLNRYAYANNSPVMYADPDGHIALLAAAGIAAAGGAFLGAVRVAGPEMIQNYREGQPLLTNVDPGEVAKAAGIGAAAATAGALTFGACMVAGGAAAGLLGITSSGGVAATTLGVATVAVSGAAAGQTSRITENLLTEETDWNEGLGDPEDLASDAILSVVTYGIASKGNFSQVAPEFPINPRDPATSPGPGWEWRGTGAPGTEAGSWYNEGSKESFRPDLDHLPPIPPHWDYKKPNKVWFRVFFDGTVEPH